MAALALNTENYILRYFLVLFIFVSLLSCGGSSDSETTNNELIGIWLGGCGWFAELGGEIYTGTFILTFSGEQFEQDIEYHSDEMCNSPRDENRSIRGGYEVLGHVDVEDCTRAEKIVFYEREFETFTNSPFPDEPRSYEMAYRVEGEKLVVGNIDPATQVATMLYSISIDKID